ncbi:hypothetical protein RUND412_000293 [Rhizina undulata]
MPNLDTTSNVGPGAVKPTSTSSEKKAPTKIRDATQTTNAAEAGAAHPHKAAIPADFGEAANHPAKIYKPAKANASKRTRISKPKSKKAAKAARNTKKLSEGIFSSVTAADVRLCQQQPQRQKLEGVTFNSKVNHGHLLMPPPYRRPGPAASDP